MLKDRFARFFSEKMQKADFAQSWLETMLWVTLAISLLYGLGALIGLVQGGFFAFSASALLCGLIWLNRRGHVRLASGAYVLVSWLALLLASLYYGGVGGASYGALALVVVFAGVLLGEGYAIVVAICNVLVGWFLLMAEEQGWLGISGLSLSPMGEWVGNSIVFLLLMVMIGMASHKLRVDFMRAHTELMKRRHAEAQMREQARYLTSLHEITLSLVERKELNSMLEFILSKAEELIETEHGYIDLVIDDDSAAEQKVGHGVFVNLQNRLVERGEGVSGRVMQDAKSMLVQDYQLWPHRNPAFSQAGFHAILAVPMISQGRVVGVIGLAYIDPQKAFSQNQLYVLERYAELASIAYDNARLFENNQQELAGRELAQRALMESEESLTLALDAAGMGIWSWDVSENQMRWSSQVYSIFGFKDDISGLDFERYISFIHPADRKKVMAEIENSLHLPEQSYHVEHRVLWPDGQLRWLEVRGRVNVDAGHHPVRMAGTIMDVTDKKLAERALQQANKNLARYTSVLEQRSNQLKVAAEVARAASGILEPKILSQKVVELVAHHFRLYYAGLFWVNENKTSARLTAATGEAGRQMMKAGYHLEVADTSMVGWCIRHGEARIALDVGKDAVRFNNPQLPETRSELAMPLISRGEVLGALTIQSSQPSAFSREDIATFQTMADQLANALLNARLYDQLQRELEERIRAEEEVRQLNMELEERVQRRTAALQASEEKFRALTENNPLRIRRYDREGRYLYANHPWTDDPSQPEQVVGKRIREVLQDSELVEIAERSIRQVFDTGQPMNLEYKFGDSYASWWLAPEFGPDGQVTSVVTSAIDITERRQMEEDLKQRSAELQAANRELEAFSYSVSHDLRAPLRALDGFSRILLEDYQQNLGDDGSNYLNRIRHAAQEMNRLIDDILRLSRVTRTELRMERLNLSDLAGAIAGEILSRDPQRTVEVAIEAGMVAQGDERLLRVALENLINNACKFSGKNERPRVEIGCQIIERKKIFFVRDNGVGFDMKYADKLFGAFQRLHSSEDFPGTGIGLAIVQRVIQKHGGKIWAESALNRGATFFFSLP